MPSGLILPRHLVQMAKPVVYWYASKIDWIILPADPNYPPIPGYQKIECTHAHEVDKWSAKLRAQEQRMRELKAEERYEVEDPIRSYGLAEMENALKTATDPANRLFLRRSIDNIKKKREQSAKEHWETYMACEAKEGVAK